MLEVLEAVAGAVGAERTGIRLSPYNSFLSASDDSTEKAIEKNVWLMKEMDKRVPNLAYIHMVSRVQGCKVVQGCCPQLVGYTDTLLPSAGDMSGRVVGVCW
jgi:2,4-dienoyl-CoA reductase-like NADH-dependent reductase (Old Yellow Enzyme family)